MGNELSNNKEVTQNVKVPEKHENGSVNGVSANITSNGLEINVNSETVVQQNGEPISINLSTESNERDFVVVDAAPVVSETPEPVVPNEEVKKKKPEKVSLFGKMFKKKDETPPEVESEEKPIETPNEDQADACPPAADLQPELIPIGEEAANMIIDEHNLEMEDLQQTAEMSTQTDETTEVNISTQTCHDDDDAAEQEVVMQSATIEDQQDMSAVIVAEEAAEVTANEDNDITAEVMCEDDAHCHPEEESIDRSEETEPEISTQTECDRIKSTAEEKNHSENTLSLEVSSSGLEVAPDELLTHEEFPEDAPQDEVNPEIDPDVITSAENTEDGEEELSPADVGENDEVTLEAAIDFLSQELEPGAAVPQEPAADVASLLIEEVISATVFLPLFGKQDIRLPVPEDPTETMVEDMSEEAIEALSNEFEAGPGSLEEDTVVQESEPVKDVEVSKDNSDEPEEQDLCPCEDDAASDVLGNTPESDNEAHEVIGNVAQESGEVTLESEHWVSHGEEENIAPAEDPLEDPADDVESSESTDPDSADSEEPVEESELLKAKDQVIIFVTDEFGVTEEITDETDGSGVVAVECETDALDEIEILDEPEAKYIHVLLETIVEDLVAEEAEGELEDEPEGVGPEIAGEEQSVGTESRENAADSAAQPETPGMNETTSVTSMNMEVLRNRLQTACQSVVEESLETANAKQESGSLTEPESTTPAPGPEEETAPDDGGSQPEENQDEEENPEKNPVMNFFKTLVTPTKTSKKETATPDATKDQSQEETEPEATTTAAPVSEPPVAAKGMSVPPPPPPEPPKMEIKGEPSGKLVKATPKEEPKAAAKEPEPSKGKSAKNPLSKFFRSKTVKDAPEPAAEAEVQPVVEIQVTPVEEPEPVVDVQVEAQETAEEVAQAAVEEQMVDGEPEVEDEKVDPSKTGTLEAAAKPEPPAPVREEKKPSSKSAFLSLFKAKAPEPKKASDVPAAAAAEAAQTVKAKEEPKAAGKASEVVVDNKKASEASQAGDDAANIPRKLEKRNSIHMFFKNLSQKRNSTDAGVQTEPVTVAAAAEKAK